MSQTVPLMLQEDIEQGGKEYDEDIENDFAYRNNVLQATKSIRLAFIRKVYGLLTMQIFLTIVIASVCMFTPPIRSFVHSNDWMLMVTFSEVSRCCWPCMSSEENPLRILYY
ncbi:hypothetical protein JTB14_008569 [Gonioctena quinquepunctata]|nr:hypothetical protein JTB14_008569 [Gonioctena quinquepunctata]